MTILALSGLIATFTSTIYAYGRVLFSLSRAGYVPRWISITSRRHTPYVALILGGVIGLICAMVIDLTGGDKEPVGAALVNMTVFGAVISYAMVMVSFIKLRWTRPDMPRPYRSPLGVPGAAVGTVLSLIALAACFAVPLYRTAVYGVTIFFALAILFFMLHSRHHLVAKAPEEENALLDEAQKDLAH